MGGLATTPGDETLGVEVWVAAELEDEVKGEVLAVTVL